MTLLAGVLIIGGLLFAILFVVGTVLFFGMLIHGEVSEARAQRAEEPSAVADSPRTSGRTTSQTTRVNA